MTLAPGIIDNIYGANFNVDPPTGDVMDQHGHGTHVSGVIGAVGNNDIGITGVNQARLKKATLHGHHSCMHATEDWQASTPTPAQLMKH